MLAWIVVAGCTADVATPNPTAPTSSGPTASWSLQASTPALPPATSSASLPPGPPIDPVTQMQQAIEPGVMRRFRPPVDQPPKLRGPSVLDQGMADGDVVRTDYSDALTTSWDFGGGNLAGRTADGRRWLQFADGSSAYFNSAGPNYTAVDGTQSQCRWEELCVDLPDHWVDEVPLGLPALALQEPGGSMTGDPHVWTADGSLFDSQLAGEFIARSGDPGHDVQVRFTPAPGRSDGSLLTGVAIGTPGHRVTVTSSPRVQVRVDGKVLAAPEVFRQRDLDDGVTVGFWEAGTRDDMTGRPTTVAVLWPDLGAVYLMVSPVYGITLVSSWTTAGQTGGLFGRQNGDPVDDLTLRSGDPTNEPGVFAESWRISAEESLFDYDPGTGTDTFTLLDFPRALPQPIPGAAEEAGQVCDSLNLADPEALRACVFDLSVTGDPGFAVGHQIVRDVAEASARDRQVLGWLRWRAGDLVPDDLQLTPDDIAGALLTPTDGTVLASVTAGSAATYQFEIPVNGTLRLDQVDVSCTQAFVPDGEPGYQLFDSNLVPVSAALSPCSDSGTVTVTPGSYYLKLIGPMQGTAEVFHLQANYR